MTSIGSIEKPSLISANSLASAMFTARKVFSYSLVISAASGELTQCTLGVSTLITRCAIAVHTGVTPPSTRGVSAWVCVTLPGSIRSGLDATNRSRPIVNPLATSGFTSSRFEVPT